MNLQSSPLGLWTLTALVIANMIGAGVFTTSGFALGDLGSPALVLLAWLIGGIVALAGAVSYGLLVRLRPESGGEYLFLSRNVHPLAGFLAGWVSLLAGFTGAIAFAALTFTAYAAPGLEDSVSGSLLASALIAFAAVLHGFRVRSGTMLQNVAIALKLLMIAAFCLYAVMAGDVADWPGLSGAAAGGAAEFSVATFALSLMWISFSYSGFNAGIYLAGEVPAAATRVPRALIAGTAITMLVYLVLNAVFVLAPPFDSVAFQEDVAAIAALHLGGEGLATAVRVLIALALFTSVSAMIMIGPRVYAKMADDGLLPPSLRFTGETPQAAIWVQAGLAIVVVWIAGLRELLSYLGFTLGLSTAATIASLFVAVKRHGRSSTPLPGYPYVPLAFVICTIVFAALAATVRPIELLAAVLTVAVGVAAYFALRRSGPA